MRDRRLPSATPRGSRFAVVELNQHIGDEACREFLQKCKSSKSSKIAKQLLALTAADFTTATRPILLQVLQQRAAAAQLDFR